MTKHAISRRVMLASSFAAPALLRASFTKKPFFYSEIEAKIARRDFRGITKEDLPTPCLIVDKPLFEQNLKRMAGHCKSTGIDLRAHCKIHKSVDIAKRQVALGSVGICCATIAECELMSGAGIKNVLYTVQPAGKNKIWRAVTLAAKDPTFMVVADDPLTVDWVDEAAAALKIRVTMLVDLFSGLTRAGHPTGTPGLELAKKIDSKKHLKFGGVMGYSGYASHTKGFEERRQRSIMDVGPVVETANLCKKAGLNVPLITGGSTGTYNIDKEIGLTELQAGSYVFMDTGYMYIGSKNGDKRYDDFQTSLTVLTTVVSKNHPHQVTIDAGNKAMLRPTDQVKDRPDIIVENQGAEYGILKWKDGEELKLGQKVELYCSNLDMSTNVYDRYFVFEGERLVDVWPIMGRAGALQR
ncbi:MAG: alanine racemase [Bryobacteraceae bacterium]|nr:alanine racemase [Bryobacteraceae bacterium]MDW8379339.1 alanine racemase [Bryobacterales bacterium]